MPSLFGSPGSSLFRYQSKASELNNKFESDYHDCLNVLEKEKRNPAPDSGDQISIDDVPVVISAPTDAASRQEMLRRTKSPYSSTTQKMFVASAENGIVVTSNREFATPKASKNSSVGTGDASTLPTFQSVGTSINWQHEQRDDTLFLVSKESVEELPIMTPVSLESKSPNTERETRKRLHYKEKLRLLTESLTTSSAVERSRKMLSDIRENGIAAEKNESINECGNTPEEKTPEAKSKYKRVYDGLKKHLYACSMRMCVDDAVVDHEGLIVAVPTRGFGCRCTEGIESTGDDYDEDASGFSSLTGPTTYRFQPRYWMNGSDNEMVWI
mmetsp:Transcript_3540/g.9049  ORF Transcript_3540/g.9049 Transcript_3540/m.9049 type:complete len:328 (-) Transcript_3540:192-1175(-)